jgi:dTDP-4-amino-4,6-dideoxygalactose transaminase
MTREVPFFDLAAMHAEVRNELDAAWLTLNRSLRFIGGEFVDRFETEWAAYCGAEWCVGVSNGTAALELTLRCLGIGAGNEVIVPANSFIATAAAVTRSGASPVFIDVDPSTLLLTAEGVSAAITSRTAAVIAVHLYGQPADMDSIGRVAERAGIAVIEDAAQAHGATWNGKRAGSFSRAGCFSFYPGKNLGALGDAGAVVTSDRALADRIRSMSNHGRLPHASYVHQTIGSNDRLDAFQAAALSIKLKHLDKWNDGRQRIAELYGKLLAELPVRPVLTAPGAHSNHHLVVIQVDRRDELRRHLAGAGIETGIHYPIPCHRQMAYSKYVDGSLCLPVTEHAADHVLSLPMFPHLEDVKVRLVVETVAQALSEMRQRERFHGIETGRVSA